MASGNALIPGPVFAALEDHGVEFVVIGGLAAQLHGSTEPTRGIDLTPDLNPPNLVRLAAALMDLHAREYVPGFGEPLQLPMDRRRLSGEVPLLTRTDFGCVDVIPTPYGFADGYDELVSHARNRYAYGQMLYVADLEDLMRSAQAGGRAKDRVATARLRHLREVIHRVRVLEPHELAYPPLQPPSLDLSLERALTAADQLSVVFEEVRPAVDFAKRQLCRAVDDVMYGDLDLFRQRLNRGRSAVREALEELTALREGLHPGLDRTELEIPPVQRGDADLSATLAYQAHDELSTAMCALSQATHPSLADHRDKLRDRLVEARLRVSTADAHLDHLHIQLDRSAREWSLDRNDLDLGRD